MTDPIWIPSQERIAQANMSAFLRYAGDFTSYGELYRWSVLHPDQFWPVMWEFSSLIAETTEETETAEKKPWTEVVRGLDRMAPPDHDLGPMRCRFLERTWVSRLVSRWSI